MALIRFYRKGIHGSSIPRAFECTTIDGLKAIKSTEGIGELFVEPLEGEAFK